MSSLLENGESIEAVNKTVVAHQNLAPGTVGQVAAESGPSVLRDLVPISDLSLKDHLDSDESKESNKRRSHDDLAKRVDENGTITSSGGSHKYSTCRNLSNVGSSLSGTPPSTGGFREEIMTQWITKSSWPSGPSFLFDNLTEEAQHSRGIARSSVLASVGSGFIPDTEKKDDYPKQIMIEGIIEGTDQVPFEARANE